MPLWPMADEVAPSAVAARDEQAGEGNRPSEGQQGSNGAARVEFFF